MKIFKGIDLGRDKDNEYISFYSGDRLLFYDRISDIKKGLENASVSFLIKGTHKEVRVSLEDLEKVFPYNWKFENGYAVAYSKGCKIRMHRLIMGLTEHKHIKKIVDHINNDRLDNRRENLRICTIRKNGQNKAVAKNNTSGQRGVYWREDTKKWRVQIVVNGKRKYFGCYNTLEEAKKVHKRESKKLYGKFA